MELGERERGIHIEREADIDGVRGERGRGDKERYR